MTESLIDRLLELHTYRSSLEEREQKEFESIKKQLEENAEIVERLKARMKIIEELPDSHDILNDMYVETKYLSPIWLELSKLLVNKK